MQIRAATLNAWALPAPLGELVPERMRAIGNELGRLELDLVALQEVWTAAARRTLVRAGDAAGLVHAWTDDAGLGGSGIVILSRHPFAAARVERFSLPRVPPRPDHPDYYVGKGFVELLLDLPSCAVRVIATHLHARYQGDVAHAYRAYRTGQIIELATALRSATEPVILLGDLNLQDTDAEYRVLRGLTCLRDAAVEIGRREPTVDGTNPFRNSGREPKRIDYVLVRDGPTAGIHVSGLHRIFDAVFDAGGRTASFSDHAGLVADISLHDSPRPSAKIDSRAIGLAASLLAEGRARTEMNRSTARVAAGAGWAGALVATRGARSPRFSRRSLLRTSIQFGGLAALTPAVACTLIAEVFSPDELLAFDQLLDRLYGLLR